VLKGFGAITSFDVGGWAEADAFCRRARLTRHPTRLGAVESTMVHQTKDGAFQSFT
jgi:cystathionine gamma-synthase